MSYNPYGNTPAPREPYPEEHKVRPEYEEIDAKRGDLNPLKVVGHGPLKGTIHTSKGPVEAPIAAVVVETQTNIPLDKFPPIRKIPTGYKSYNSQIVWPTGTERIRWEQDPEFFYIPCYSRYVINPKTLEIRNGFNGVSLGQYRGPRDRIELISDSRSRKPYGTSFYDLAPFVFGSIPKGFLDYGMGNRTYDGLIMPKPDSDGLFEVQWKQVPKITVRNDIDRTVVTMPNFHEFLITKIKDFNLQKEGRLRYKDLKPEETMSLDTYTIMLGEDVPAEKFGPIASDSGIEFDEDDVFNY